MISVEILKKRALAPEKFSELTEAQLYLLAYCSTYGKTVMDTQVYLASQILGKVWQLNEKLIQQTIIDFRSATQKEQLHEKLESLRNNRFFMSQCFAWVSDEQTTDRWLIPSLTLRRWFWVKHFKGPSFRFANIAFWQWCQAEFFFFKYIKTGKRDFFNKFCACIYMPTIGGFAAKYDDALIDRNAKYFDKLTPVQVNAIRINYIAVKSWIALNHPNVFQRREHSDEQAIETIDMAELLLRAAKAQHLDEDVVAKKPLLTELKKLELNAQDYKDAKQKMEDNK